MKIIWIWGFVHLENSDRGRADRQMHKLWRYENLDACFLAVWEADRTGCTMRSAVYRYIIHRAHARSHKPSDVYLARVQVQAPKK